MIFRSGVPTPRGGCWTPTPSVRLPILIVILALGLASGLRADTIHLAEGKILEGTIVESTEKGIVVESGGTKIRLRRERLAKPEPDALAKAKIALEAGDAAAARKLAETLSVWEPENAEAKTLAQLAGRVLLDQEASKILGEMQSELDGLAQRAASVPIETLDREIEALSAKCGPLTAKYGASAVGDDFVVLAGKLEEAAQITGTAIAEANVEKNERIAASQKATQERILAQKAAEYRANLKRKAEESRRQREIAAERRRQQQERSETLYTFDASGNPVPMSQQGAVRMGLSASSSLSPPSSSSSSSGTSRGIRICRMCHGSGQNHVAEEAAFGSGQSIEVSPASTLCPVCGGKGYLYN